MLFGFCCVGCCFDSVATGSIRLEPGMKVREEKNCKKSPFAFMVETPVSQLVFFCESEKYLTSGRDRADSI